MDRKDALDIYRLLSLDSTDLADRMTRLLAEPTTKAVTTGAIEQLVRLFGSVDSPGSVLAGEAVAHLMDPYEMQQSVNALAEELVETVRAGD